MKKTYFTPALVAVKIESAQVICGSPEFDAVPTKETEEMNSNRYQGGFLWEDDNAE